MQNPNVLDAACSGGTTLTALTGNLLTKGGTCSKHGNRNNCRWTLQTSSGVYFVSLAVMKWATLHSNSPQVLSYSGTNTIKYYKYVQFHTYTIYYGTSQL